MQQKKITTWTTVAGICTLLSLASGAVYGWHISQTPRIVGLTFNMCKDGSVRSMKISRSSGSAAIDNAVLESSRRCQIPELKTRFAYEAPAEMHYDFNLKTKEGVFWTELKSPPVVSS